MFFLVLLAAVPRKAAATTSTSPQRLIRVELRRTRATRTRACHARMKWTAQQAFVSSRQRRALLSQIYYEGDSESIDN